MNIGILCPSEIAYRRFLPALKLVEKVEFAGVAVNTPQERYGEFIPKLSEVSSMLSRGREKAQKIINEYGGKLYSSFEEMILAPNIDALYIPLPPALHYKWAKLALEHEKHVLIEKPSTISSRETDDLIRIAQEKKLALHENYMFMFHDQLNAIDEIIRSGEIGDVRLYRILFGFPRRTDNDFRYNKELGGGALIDAGGYTIKYASRLLGESAEIKYANLNYLDEFNVDIYGSATLVNADGLTAQIAFGMDNDYKCELEVWGSEGTLTTGRVFTAPMGFLPTVSIKKNQEFDDRTLPADDAFKNSIEHFIRCVGDSNVRQCNYKEIQLQARLVNQLREMAEQ